MSSGSSNSGIPGGLAPIGGWKTDDTPSPLAPISPGAPPAARAAAPPPPAAAPVTRSAMGTIGADTAPLAPPPLVAAPTTPAVAAAITPPPGAPRSRFDTLPPAATGASPAVAAAPASRFAAPPAAAVAAAPVLATPVPERERAYSLAGAYRRGEVAPMGGGRMAAGIATGIIVGGIITFLWILLYLFTRFYWFMLLGAGMGFVVGWAVFKATGEGEETTCWISCIISTVYAILGVGLINYMFWSVFGFPDIVGIVFGVAAIAAASERGFRTPEVLAVDTAF